MNIKHYTALSAKLMHNNDTTIEKVLVIKGLLQRLVLIIILLTVLATTLLRTTKRIALQLFTLYCGFCL